MSQIHELLLLAMGNHAFTAGKTFIPHSFIHLPNTNVSTEAFIYISVFFIILVFLCSVYFISPKTIYEHKTSLNGEFFEIEMYALSES